MGVGWGRAGMDHLALATWIVNDLDIINLMSPKALGSALHVIGVQNIC